MKIICTHDEAEHLMEIWRTSNGKCPISREFCVGGAYPNCTTCLQYNIDWFFIEDDTHRKDMIHLMETVHRHIKDEWYDALRSMNRAKTQKAYKVWETKEILLRKQEQGLKEVIEILRGTQDG